MAEMTESVLERIERQKETYLEELKDYLRIPSISTDPAYGEEVERCSQFLAEKMERAGLTVERSELLGNVRSSA